MQAGQDAPGLRPYTLSIKVIDIYSDGKLLVTADTYTSKPLGVPADCRSHSEEVILTILSDVGRAGSKEFSVEGSLEKKQFSLRKIMERIYAMRLEAAEPVHEALTRLQNTTQIQGHYELRLTTKKKGRGKSRPKVAAQQANDSVRSH